VHEYCLAMQLAGPKSTATRKCWNGNYGTKLAGWKCRTDLAFLEKVVCLKYDTTVVEISVLKRTTPLKVNVAHTRLPSVGFRS